MTSLASTCPGSHPHVVDLPYRLSSWALDDPRNAHLWTDAAGHLAAWAAVQTPFWEIDCVCRPDLEASLHRASLAWALERAREALKEGSGHAEWYLTVFSEDADRRRDLEAMGFANQADQGEDSWSKVLFRQSASSTVSQQSLPPGFSIRSLRGESEVEAYTELHRAAFGTRNMTAAWRMRTLQQPAYVADLDLVAVAPDGSLAGFCVGWLGRLGEAVTGQIEPMGVLDAHRQLGLGKALIAEQLCRMCDHGARHVLVETDNTRHAALGLYPAAGFTAWREMLVYGIDLSSSAARRLTDGVKAQS